MASPFSNQGNSIETNLNSANPTSNYGASVEMQVGEWNAGTAVARGLIKWDLSSIPANATIVSAILSLYVKTDLSSNTRTLRAYRVLRNWTEGNSVAEYNATWNEYTTDSAWGTAGCGNTTSDREATDIGSVSVLHNESTGTEKQISLTASKVQEWINGTLTNNGVLLQVDTETDDLWSYDTHEGTTANLRPKLVITYTVPSGFFALL